MKRFLHCFALLVCCVTLVACSGADDETTVADAGPALAEGGEEGTGEEAASDESSTADDLFSTPATPADTDTAAEDPALFPENNLEEKTPADDADAAAGGGLFDDTAGDTAAEPAEDPLGLASDGAAEPAATDTADSGQSPLFDDLDQPGTGTPAEAKTSDDELADLTGDGPPTVEPSAGGDQSLDNLLTDSPDEGGDAAAGANDLFGAADGAAGEPVNEPQVAAEEFLDAVRDGQLATAARMIFEPTEPQWKDMVKKQVDKLESEIRSGITTIEVLEPRREGNWVLVVCKVTTTRDNETRDRISDQYFYLVDRHWKMMPETVRTDAAGQAVVNADFDMLTEWYQENKPTLEQRYLNQ